MQKRFAEKDIIFREGEPTREAYIILSGKVEILKKAAHGEVQLAVLEQGALFGEMSILAKKAMRSASARALEPTVVDVIDGDRMQQMLEGAPEPLVTLIYNLFERLKSMNAKLASKERASTLLDDGIEKLIISPTFDSELEGGFETITLNTANLPFSIGGYLEGNPQEKKHNSLDIPSKGPPLIISQKHCAIELQGNSIFVVDKGSRFCTIVNSKAIGRGKASTKAQLRIGENKITLGDHTSPYKLTIIAE